MTLNQAFFDEGIDRRGTDCHKWDDRNVCPENAIPLWIADMDFRCAPEITRALKERAAHPVYGYTFASQQDHEAFRSFWFRRHQVRIEPHEMMMLPCVVTGLRLCVRALTQPGDAVILMDPVYGPFYTAVTLNGRQVKRCTLLRDSSGEYHMDFEKLEQFLREGARVVLFCNPHNPVSRAWHENELQQLVDIIRRHRAYLVSDEIHADFVYAPERVCSALQVPGHAECVIAMMSASKTFNIAGLQQAELVTRNPRLLKRIRDEADMAGVLSGNLFAMTASKAAYASGDAWLDALLVYLDANRRKLKDWLSQALPEAVLAPVTATYLAWVDFSSLGFPAEELESRIRKSGTVLTMGGFFGEDYGQFARINFGCPSGMLQEGIERLRNALIR